MCTLKENLQSRLAVRSADAVSEPAELQPVSNATD